MHFPPSRRRRNQSQKYVQGRKTPYYQLREAQSIVKCVPAGAARGAISRKMCSCSQGGVAKKHPAFFSGYCGCGLPYPSHSRRAAHTRRNQSQNVFLQSRRGRKKNHPKISPNVSFFELVVEAQSISGAGGQGAINTSFFELAIEAQSIMARCA